MRRYILYPGDMKSKNDTDWHFIDAGRLAELWGVRMSDCFVCRDGNHERGVDLSQDYRHLTPRFDGDYRL